jgi:hypothetical protein
MSAIINGSQVDFEAAILTQSDPQLYEHYYTVRETEAGSDLNDEYANVPITSCYPNPCENSGTCLVVLGGIYYCACTTNFTGKF